ALLVVGRARVGGGEVVVRRDDAADLVERLASRLTREDLVLDGLAGDPPVLDALVHRGHTARPHASSASRPASVMRDADHGGFQTMFTRTSRTPSSRSR